VYVLAGGQALETSTPHFAIRRGLSKDFVGRVRSAILPFEGGSTLAISIGPGRFNLSDRTFVHDSRSSSGQLALSSAAN